MSFYANLAAVATKLLQSKGQLVTVSRTTGATLDPAAGEYTGGTTTQFTGYGAAFDYAKSEIDGELIQAGDVRFLFEATDTAPLVGDNLLLDSVNYRVMSIIKTSPGGTVVLYELQLRQ